MARERVFEVSGLNLRINSKHDPKEYETFWRALHSLKWSSIWGHDALMIGDVKSEPGTAHPRYLYGDFYRFLNIDPTDPWFDVSKKKLATEAEISEINIPNNLKPNFSMCPYVFDLDRHRLYLISRSTEKASVPIQRVHKLVETLSKSNQILERFHDVHVTVLQDRKQVFELLKWPVIRRLEILIERPNPDEDEDELKALKKLEGMGARSELRVWQKSRDVPTLVVDEKTRDLAYVAAENGVVKVKGKNPQGQRDKASSTSFPMHTSASYDPDSGTLFEAFRQFVIKTFF